MDEMDDIDELEEVPLITNQPSYQSLYKSQNVYSNNQCILADDKNSSSRINQHINKITSIISKQYRLLGYVDLTLWNNHYYYSGEWCILEYVYDCCCCINYNPEYNPGNDNQGFGRCCGIDIYQDDTFNIGYLICCIPYLLCLPWCMLDCWYKKCYGYSRTGFLEYIGNYILECCVCQCWEKWFYMNIHIDEMENVYELVKYMYNGILEVDIKKYSTNWRIKIKSLE